MQMAQLLSVLCGQLQGGVVLLLLHLWRMPILHCWVLPQQSCRWLGAVMTTVRAGCLILLLCGCCTAVAQPEVAPGLAPAANALPAAGPVAWHAATEVAVTVLLLQRLQWLLLLLLLLLLLQCWQCQPGTAKGAYSGGKTCC
jgi:hypothetical protein